MRELNSTDKKIIDATFDLLQKEGSGKTTTKKIAAEAGVNEVTIFRNFENKKNLIEITKEYYLENFISKLENIFSFEENEEIDEYLKTSFIKFSKLQDSDFSIIKIGMEEIGEASERKQLLSRITNQVISKLEDFFNTQIEKGKMRPVDSRSLSVMCFSIIFQSNVLWRIYDEHIDIDFKRYDKNFLDILYNGIEV